MNCKFELLKIAYMAPSKNASYTFNTFYSSPLGMIKISGNESGIQSVLFTNEEVTENKENAFLAECAKQLDEYFKGERKQFQLTLNPQGTDFQKKVWQQLQELTFGKTTTYGAISKKMGDANLMRAVGMANGKNPIVIIIPCHRVIGADGTLTGYAGGLERKKWLLDFEQTEKQGQLF